jgi:hypothetical protein
VGAKCHVSNHCAPSDFAAVRHFGRGSDYHDGVDGRPRVWPRHIAPADISFRDSISDVPRVPSLEDIRAARGPGNGVDKKLDYQPRQSQGLRSRLSGEFQVLPHSKTSEICVRNSRPAAVRKMAF